MNINIVTKVDITLLHNLAAIGRPFDQWSAYKTGNEQRV